MDELICHGGRWCMNRPVDEPSSDETSKLNRPGMKRPRSIHRDAWKLDPQKRNPGRYPRAVWRFCVALYWPQNSSD